MPPALDPLPEEARTRLAELKAQIEPIGIVLRGSVTERYVPCGKKGCRCQADPPRLHGPYYEWTTKVAGKTRNVRLRPDQARTYREWIANSRQLDQLIAEWEQIGLEAAAIIRETLPP